MNFLSRTFWVSNEVAMAARRLFIFVEGSDDVRFFETIIKPRFEHIFESVELITFACTKSVKVDRFIRGINAMQHSYIIVTDIDFEKSVPAKKSIILSFSIQEDTFASGFKKKFFNALSLSIFAFLDCLFFIVWICREILRNSISQFFTACFYYQRMV